MSRGARYPFLGCIASLAVRMALAGRLCLGAKSGVEVLRWSRRSSGLRSGSHLEKASIRVWRAAVGCPHGAWPEDTMCGSRSTGPLAGRTCAELG